MTCAATPSKPRRTQSATTTGAVVTGLDLVPSLLAAAWVRADRAGLWVALE